MRVLFVRHGLSRNNVLQEAAFHHFDGGEPDPVLFAKLKAEARADDHLTEHGHEQARLLAAMYAAPLRRLLSAGKAVQIFCSVQNRPLETIIPLAEQLALPIVVTPDLHEIAASGPPVPGMLEFTEHMKAVGTDKIWKTAEDLRSQHPLIDTSRVPSTGPVLPNGSMTAPVVTPDGNIVPEPTVEEQYGVAAGRMVPGTALMDLVSARSRNVASFLRSDDVQSRTGADGLAIVCSHGAFVGSLIARLIGMDTQQAFASGIAGPSMPNTGTTLMDVPVRIMCILYLLVAAAAAAAAAVT